MSGVSAHFRRMMGRVDAVLDSIESGEDPAPKVRIVHDAAPWDAVKVGQEFVLDALETEDSFDGDDNAPARSV